MCFLEEEGFLLTSLDGHSADISESDNIYTGLELKPLPLSSKWPIRDTRFVSMALFCIFIPCFFSFMETPWWGMSAWLGFSIYLQRTSSETQISNAFKITKANGFGLLRNSFIPGPHSIYLHSLP
jgi:hypothetical protein